MNYEDVTLLIGPPPFGKKKLIGPEQFEISVNEDAGEPEGPAAPLNPEESKQA